MSVFTGRLSFAGKWKIIFFDEKKQKESVLFCQKNIFSNDFQPEQGEETEVDFERDSTPQKNPIKVRAKGQEWKGQEKASIPDYNRQSTIQQNQREGDRNQRGFQNQQRNSFSQTLKGEFHNPYNFVPAIPRDKVSNELKDDKPIGHDKFHEGYFSGKLSVKLITETPLLLLDTSRLTIEGDHKSYPVKLDVEGKPFLEPAAVKGMLRSAYEVVTNSRMSVFTKHEDRLAFRRDAKSPIPVRVEEKDGSFFAKPLEYQKIDNHVMNHVAKLPRYEKSSRRTDKGEKFASLKYSDGSLPKHGESVWVKYRKIKAGAEVQEIRLRKEGESLQGEWKAGWVCVTGANINGKRFERVFLDVPNAKSIPLNKDFWEELIRNYQEIHKKELEKRAKDGKEPTDYLGDKPGQTAWSKHIYDKSDLELKAGTLCYAEIVDGEIKSVFPVMISRQLFECSPSKLLPDLLKPASDIEKLSPADRVFGCVVQNSKGKANAYRGQIRIGSIKTEQTDTIQIFDDFLPLNILGQPKPQQGRFYVAKNKLGNAQDKGLSNEQAGYNSPLTKGLRGRKVYPHHANLPSDYWTVQNSLREYLRPKKERDNQNRSIGGWIKPRTEFTFDIHFMNLSEVELGALVWLLQLPQNHFHRLGGGKPFGFGSVYLSLENSQITGSEDIKEFYSSLDHLLKESKKPEECKKSFINAYQVAGYQKIIDSFLQSCKGFEDNKPTHYPRKTQTLSQDGKSFEWFVANNKMERREVRNGYVLKNITDDDGLPYLD